MIMKNGNYNGSKGARSVRQARAVAEPDLMQFGVVLQNDPPAWRVVDLAVRAEHYGFTHVWTFDSHLLWQEPYVVYSQILSATHRVVVGPMVTNPATRDWTVTASLFATLNDMFGNRTVCGIGRGDSAVRRDQRQSGHAGDAARVDRGDPQRSRTADRSSTTAARCACRGAASSRLPIWMAAYGPKALALTGEVADGFILQLADPDIIAWSIAAVRKAAADAGRDPADVTICVAAPAYVTDGTDAGMEHARAPDTLVRRHGRQSCRRHRGALRRGRRGCAAGVERLHRRARGLRLQHARQGGATRTPISCPTR